MSLSAPVLWTTLTLVVVFDSTLLLTLTVPSLQIWPPRGRNTWEYRLTWSLFSLATPGFLAVGGLDAKSLGGTRWIGTAGTLTGGGALFGIGTAWASYAMGYLGRRGALGLERELITDGPFSVTRNPGYLGDLLLMVGYTLLSDSRQAGLLALIGSVWFLLAPLAEEPWLEAHYGEPYRRYKERCPRWI